MKFFGGWYFPDHEEHLLGWMQNDPRAQEVDGRLSYQYHKLTAALQHCSQFRVAVDVGAHIGLMSWHLAKRFHEVHAFEPVEEHRRCFMRNVYLSEWVGPHLESPGEDGKAVYLHQCALGHAPGFVSLTTRPTSSGDTFVSGPGDIEMRTLDSFELPALDFIKIDCEGFESQVIRGAAETLSRCKPVVIVEQKAKNLKANYNVEGAPAVEMLRELGAHVHQVLSGDFIMSWSRS